MLAMELFFEVSQRLEDISKELYPQEPGAPYDYYTHAADTIDQLIARGRKLNGRPFRGSQDKKFDPLLLILDLRLC